LSSSTAEDPLHPPRRSIAPSDGDTCRSTQPNSFRHPHRVRPSPPAIHRGGRRAHQRGVAAPGLGSAAVAHERATLCGSSAAPRRPPGPASSRRTPRPTPTGGSHSVRTPCSCSPHARADAGQAGVRGLGIAIRHCLHRVAGTSRVGTLWWDSCHQAVATCCGRVGDGAGVVDRRGVGSGGCQGRR
jgi:hypothetical protein